MTTQITAKILLLGPAQCGKTTLLEALQGKPYSHAPYTETIGVEFASVPVNVPLRSGARDIKLQIWDTAGSERFRSLIVMYFRGARAYLLCYAVNDAASLDKALALWEQFKDAVESASPVLLVGLQADDANAVSSERGAAAAAAISAEHFQVSAATGHGVDELKRHAAVATAVEMEQAAPPHLCH